MKKMNIDLNDKNYRFPALFIVTAFILVITAGITFARYVLQENHSGAAEAEAFYFTSDFLKEVSENKVYHIDPKAGSFDITFSNSADSKRITQKAITFDINVEGGTLTSAENLILNGSSKDEEKVTITPNPGSSKVTVTASSSTPYKKTLKAEFVLEPGNQYSIEDAENNRAAVLTITCVETPSDGITLIVPSGVIPDAANTMITKEQDGSFKFSPKESGVYTLVLLKKEVEKNLSRPEKDFEEADKIDLTAGEAQ